MPSVIFSFEGATQSELYTGYELNNKKNTKVSYRLACLKEEKKKKTKLVLVVDNPSTWWKLMQKACHKFLDTLGYTARQYKTQKFLQAKLSLLKVVKDCKQMSDTKHLLTEMLVLNKQADF